LRKEEGVYFWKSDRLVCEPTNEAPIYAQIDGEPLARLPVEFGSSRAPCACSCRTRAIAQRSKITFRGPAHSRIGVTGPPARFFPRASWRTLLAILFTGIVADVDSLSASFGPAAYLRWHRTITHSLVFILMLACAAFFFENPS